MPFSGICVVFHELHCITTVMRLYLHRDPCDRETVSLVSIPLGMYSTDCWYGISPILQRFDSRWGGYHDGYPFLLIDLWRRQVVPAYVRFYNPRLLRVTSSGSRLIFRTFISRILPKVIVIDLHTDTQRQYRLQMNHALLLSRDETISQYVEKTYCRRFHLIDLLYSSPIYANPIGDLGCTLLTVWPCGTYQKAVR